MISKAKLSRLVSLALMIAILIVAAIFNAMTAMRVAIRGREVVVQDLKGKTEADARQLLEKNGLILKVSQTRFTPGVQEGLIVEQNPPKGTSLMRQERESSGLPG
jgi:beta-lactam-binding protein with PASTA domain